MTSILVLYYSSYGHIERMAEEIAAGAREITDTTVAIKRVPEIMERDAAEGAGYKLDQTAPVATVDELAGYDAIIFGIPTRFGNMAAQMRNFFDQTGGLWMEGKLVGKVGSVFVSTGTGGGNETTITSTHTTLFHHGMIVVGLPYACQELMDVSVVKGGSPLGAGTIAGPAGDLTPNDNELAQARFQGRHVAQITGNLVRGGAQ